MDAQLGAEPAADERRDDVDPLLASIRSVLAIDGTRRVDDLGADVDGQVLAARYRQAGMRLHRLGELVRRRVELIDLDRGAVERGVEVADRGVGRQSGVHHLRGVRLVLARGEVEVSRLDGVVDVDEMRRRARLLEGRRRRRAPRARRSGGCRGRSAPAGRASTASGWTDRRVPCAGAFAMGHHQAHAGRPLGAGGVDPRDAALADRGADDEAVERLAGVPVLVGVGGPAG